MKKSIFIAVAVILAAGASVFAQDTGASLETILAQSQKQTEFYRETFKNLLADEVKTFEEFDKKGESDKKTNVKSSFLVYQSGKSAAATAELRNVLEVDGKPIPDSQKRGEEFLAELDKQTTLEKELKKLQSESSKYDKTWEVFGLTLNEAVALAPNQRPFFDFKLVGTENYQGADVYVVSYQQTKKSPYITVNEKQKAAPSNLMVNYNLDIPGELKKGDIFLRGKLWIDAKTFQIWREERELTAQPNDPVLLLANIFEYQTSDFGILVPKNITLTIFNAKKEKGSGKYSSLKDTNMSFEYSKFRQTNVEVKILDEETE
jgi:hypothetical protein